MEGNSTRMKNVFLRFVVAGVLSVGICGCLSIGLASNSAWTGGPTNAAAATALVADVVTLPVQLPYWILVGLDDGFTSLNRYLDDRSWESKRRRLHAKFRKDPVKMEATEPEFGWRGASLGMVYADESIPLSEKFLIAHAMKYLSFTRFGIPIGKYGEIAALMRRREWTAEALRAIAPQFSLGRSTGLPAEVLLAYLSNPQTPRTVVENFAKFPSFKYRNNETYCKTLRNEITTNILAQVTAGVSNSQSSAGDSVGVHEVLFGECLRDWLGKSYARKAHWSKGGDQNLYVVGVPQCREEILIAGIRARIVALQGDSAAAKWKENTEFRGAVEAMTLEFESMGDRDRFLKAVIPICGLCEPKCWSQLLFVPPDDPSGLYGICIQYEPCKSPARIFIIDLRCNAEIRFWVPWGYSSQHVWFADSRIL